MQRHAEEVSGATARLRAETAAAAERTAALLAHRRALVAALVQALQSLAIPGKLKFTVLLHFNSALKYERPSIEHHWSISAFIKLLVITHFYF